MEWVRGDPIGHGSFATVSLAIPTNQNLQFPPLMAVKSCDASHSSFLMNEKCILNELQGCQEIIRCLGEKFSFEKGKSLYNVLLEYASGGSLADQIKKSGNNRLPESEVRRYTNSVLRGLHYIHKNGFVHCDVKLQNILLFSSQKDHKFEAKIADFGLAKRIGDESFCSSRCEFRGTPLYMSPEVVTGGHQEAPADIWALGCVVAEMVTGFPAWRCSDVAGLLMRIGVGEEVPEIPGTLSEEGKDFLRKCFEKDPRKRWTAEMLLDHSFLDNDDHNMDTVPLKYTERVERNSPRGPFDHLDWVSIQSTCSITSLPELSPENGWWCQDEVNSSGFCSISPVERVKQLVTDQRPDWSVSKSWMTVR